MKRPFEHIVFDVDGTLLDTKEALLRSLQETLQKVQGKTYTLDELLFSFGIPGAVSLQRLGVTDVESALRQWGHSIVQFWYLCHMFEGTRELLHSLRDAGYSLGIVTSKTRTQLQPDLDTHGFGQYFSTIICVEDTTTHKPEAGPLCKYMEVTGTSAERVLYVGDSVYDMLCAKNAGVSFALATWGATDKTLEAQYAPQTPQQLQKLLCE